MCSITLDPYNSKLISAQAQYIRTQRWQTGQVDIGYLWAEAQPLHNPFQKRVSQFQPDLTFITGHRKKNKRAGGGSKGSSKLIFSLRPLSNCSFFCIFATQWGLHGERTLPVEESSMQVSAEAYGKIGAYASSFLKDKAVEWVMQVDPDLTYFSSGETCVTRNWSVFYMGWIIWVKCWLDTGRIEICRL